MLTARAPAKINLTLHVLGRRADGYHELESFVAFAGVGDVLSFEPGEQLALALSGPNAGKAGPEEDNLVLRGARELAKRVEGLRLGSFHLIKRLPVASGIGGGSSDAAAALGSLQPQWVSCSDASLSRRPARRERTFPSASIRAPA